MAKKSQLTGNFKTLLRFFCLEGSVLGLKYFYLYPNKVSRCFWAVTMLATLYMACLLSLLLYRRFAEMPTRITIENQYETTNVHPFPAIAICSPNQVSISSMLHFNKTLVDGNLTINLHTALPLLLGFFELTSKVRQEELQHLQSLIDLNRYSVPEVLAMMPISCENFLKVCFFKYKVYPGCRGLFYPLLTTHGLCCVFNSPYSLRNGARNEKNHTFEPQVIGRLGNLQGLVVVSDYDPDDALDGTLLTAGTIRMMFNDWTEFPSDDESERIGTNVESFHSIRGTYTYCSEDVSQLSSERYLAQSLQTTKCWISRGCYFEDENLLPHFRRYRNSDCDLECYVKRIQKSCHCDMYFLPYVRPERTCNMSAVTCISNVKRQIMEMSSVDECVCPRDCNSRLYTVDTSIGNLNSLQHMPVNPYQGINFTKSTNIMHFVYPQATYVKKKQETVMSIISLCSNLGGVFGLCLGCSIMSVLEIGFLIQKYISNRMRERSKLRARQHRKNKESIDTQDSTVD